MSITYHRQCGDMRERAGGLERHSTRICIQRLQEADCCESVTRTASVHHRVTVCTAGCCNSAVAAAVGPSQLTASNGLRSAVPACPDS